MTEQRYLIKTSIPGWFQMLDGTNVLDKKVRKHDGDLVFDSVDEALTTYRVNHPHSGNGASAEPQKSKGALAAEKADVPVTVSDTGRVLVGVTVTIECQADGCTNKRVIKPQDRFQVRYCVPHQLEHRKQVRREKQRAKTKARREARDQARQATTVA